MLLGWKITDVLSHKNFGGMHGSPCLISGFCYTQHTWRALFVLLCVPKTEKLLMCVFSFVYRSNFGWGKQNREESQAFGLPQILAGCWLSRALMLQAGSIFLRSPQKFNQYAGLEVEDLMKQLVRANGRYRLCREAKRGWQWWGWVTGWLDERRDPFLASSFANKGGKQILFKLKLWEARNATFLSACFFYYRYAPYVGEADWMFAKRWRYNSGRTNRGKTWLTDRSILPSTVTRLIPTVIMIIINSMR